MASILTEPDQSPAGDPDGDTCLPLGQLLIRQGKSNESDVARALAYQEVHGGRLGGILVRLGAISEESLLPALAEQTGYSLVQPVEIPEQAVLEALEILGEDADWARRWQLLPWRDERNVWHVAAADPLAPDLQEYLSGKVDAPVAWHFVRGLDLERYLGGLGRNLAESALNAAALRELAEDAPVISLVNSIMAQAIDERASDIHVEPGERHCEIRFRIDGVLHTRMDVSMETYPAVASRIKLIAGLDIAERRLPQDGRITLRLSGAEMDMRVSVIPAVHGESIVMRLLPKKREELSLDRLGFSASQLLELRRWLQLPNGIVLVTGPTGSGKSTTLYGALASANDHTRKIITVEDPVEHKLPGIIQIQTQVDIGYTFARALRAILRHDPDIIMIGEIRDRETAEIAIQSALTGHLVFATLHTNDALSAFTRLIDMGIEPFLVAAACQAVLAQRLVRRICPHCNRPATPEEQPTGEAADQAPADWRVAVGCGHCQHTGYLGRVGLYELVSLSAELRHAIVTQGSLAELTRIADLNGRISLRQDGINKAREGRTTVAEVLRVIGEEGVGPGLEP